MPISRSEFTLNVQDTDNQLPKEKQDLGFFDVVGDAFRIDSGFTAIAKSMNNAGRTIDLDSDFNPIERAEADGVSVDLLNEFIYANNEDEYLKLKSRVDADLTARDNLAAAGVSGFLASMTAAVASPSTLIGGAALARYAYKGASALKTAGSVAGITGGLSYAEEKLLQETQAGRTDREVWLNTIASGVLAGTIGGIATAGNKVVSKSAAKVKAEIDAHSVINEGKLPETMGELRDFNDSIGAASAKFTREQLGIAKSNSKFIQPILDGYVAVNKKFNPAVRMMSSASKRAREFFLEAADTSLKPQLVKEGGVVTESIEGALKRRYNKFSREVADFNESWKGYVKSMKGEKGKLNLKQFRDEVGKAVRRDAPHPNKFVAEAAERFKIYYDNLADELIQAKLLPEDIQTPRDGARYLNRMYLTQKIKENRAAFRSTIEPWYRKQLRSIRSRLENVATETGKGGKPTARALEARADINAHFRSGDVFEDYVNESIDSTINNLIRTKADAGFELPKAGKAGPLKQRSFDIPDEIIEDWLENDILFLADGYTRRVSPQVVFKNKLGEETIESLRDDIIAEYDEIINNTTSKRKVAKLIDERSEVLKDIDTTWSLLQGTYKGFSGDANSIMRRGAEAVMTLNYMKSLGGVALSSLPDTTMGILRRGFGNYFGRSLKPFMKNIRAVGKNMSKVEARSYGQALEYVNSLRSQTLYGIGDPMTFGSPFERALGVLGNKTSNVNLINQWNDMWQTVNVLGTRFRLVNNIDDLVTKGKLLKREQEWMNFMGISSADAGKMKRLIDNFGTKEADGAIIPNVNKWGKVEGVTAKEAKRLASNFESAINKEIDRTVLTKGITDIPRFGNTTLGRMVFQWQNFNFAFNNKVLISGLQEADGRVMAGFGSLIIGGMLTEYLKSIETGQELPDSPALWIEAGLDRSGFLGLLSYGNSYSESLFGSGYKQILGEEPNRYAGFSSLAETFLGPTGGTLRSVKKLTQSLGKDGFTQGDLHTLRTLTPWQNVIYLRSLFDQAEETIAEEFDLPKTRRKKKKTIQ